MMLVLVHIFFPEYIKDFCYEFVSRPNLFFLFFKNSLFFFKKKKRGGDIRNIGTRIWKFSRWKSSCSWIWIILIFIPCSCVCLILIFNALLSKNFHTYLDLYFQFRPFLYSKIRTFGPQRFDLQNRNIYILLANFITKKLRCYNTRLICFLARLNLLFIMYVLCTLEVDGD